MLELAKDVEVKTKITMFKGNPSLEKIKSMNSKDIDQLVIGSRSLNTYQGMVLGCVSHKVM
ncbi:universal stress protein [Sporosarcina limicola]|uniref:universal stress protein n=1 Tax=Sporosarcina limicola TaxID=34101 RepID=UPI0030B839F9